MLDQCFLEGIVSLPKNCIYSTAKKTYLLILRKKASHLGPADDAGLHLPGLERR